MKVLSGMEFKTRNIVLIDEDRRTLALLMVENMPLGTEVVGRQKTKVRTPDQNALMWSGPLTDMAQSWINGRQYSEKVWHEYFKSSFLPVNGDPELNRKVKNPETYRKWASDISRNRLMVASTTDLTTFGFSEYLEQIYAFGGEHGVLFTTTELDK